MHHITRDSALRQANETARGDGRNRARCRRRHARDTPTSKISLNGLAYLWSGANTVATVASATRNSQNYTANDDFIFGTAMSGNACNLTVTSTVTDECSGVNTSSTSDSLLARVDNEPPMIRCSVAQRVLGPLNSALVDVGFQLDLGDNCDPQPPLDVTSTCDEATPYALVTSKGDDPYPDAVVHCPPTGGVQRILLRAQRRDTSVTGSDGRVCRIRVAATDA